MFARLKSWAARVWGPTSVILSCAIVYAWAQGFILPPNSAVNGHLLSQGPPPVLTACGTTPAIEGTDVAGTITAGTTATGCVVTFAVAYANVPRCLVVWQGTPLAAQNWTTTATAITIVQTSTSNNKINYACFGQGGG